MKPVAMLGVVLIVLGIARLSSATSPWTETKPVMGWGRCGRFPGRPTVWIPTAAGIAAPAGVGLVFAGKRTA